MCAGQHGGGEDEGVQPGHHGVQPGCSLSLGSPPHSTVIHYSYMTGCATSYYGSMLIYEIKIWPTLKTQFIYCPEDESLSRTVSTKLIILNNND